MVPQACFESVRGRERGRCFEFEVASEAAGAEPDADGHTLLHPARTEPWGQMVVRVLSSEGVIVGISYQPWMHEG